MTFALDDRWVWDFWVAKDGSTYHLFFLQADRSLGNPDLRHWHASIGHAVSNDLINWRYLGPCFAPAPAPAWDDGTTWTGSVIRHADRWHMFYTGTCRAEESRKQRIGHAVSHNLHDWERDPSNPVVDLAPDLYEEYDPSLWHDRSLRDPWVAADPLGRGFRMWFTARAATGSADGRGVIGTAHSPDLVRWTVEPPLTTPGDFGEVEVPQFFAFGGRYYLIFCTSAQRTSARRTTELSREGRHPETGTHYFMADRPEGPWRLGPLPFLSASTGPLYAGRVVRDPTGNPQFLGFMGTDARGVFHGAISDPIQIVVDDLGTLRLQAALGSEQSPIAPPTGMAAIGT